MSNGHALGALEEHRARYDAAHCAHRLVGVVHAGRALGFLPYAALYEYIVIIDGVLPRAAPLVIDVPVARHAAAAARLHAHDRLGMNAQRAPAVQHNRAIQLHGKLKSGNGHGSMRLKRLLQGLRSVLTEQRRVDFKEDSFHGRSSPSSYTL